jgi:hypothetical protein
MMYVVKMDSGDMIYIPSFIKICSGIQILIRGILRQASSLVVSLAYFYFHKLRNKLSY